MAEWSKALVLKTRDSLRGPWVRIPLPPHELREGGGSGAGFLRSDERSKKPWRGFEKRFEIVYEQSEINYPNAAQNL